MDDLRRKVDTLEAEAARLRDLLAASEARHALILESATDYAIITTDLAGRITGWNVGAHNVLGWQEAEALGQPAHLFFTPEDRAAEVPEKEMEEGPHAGPGFGRPLAFEARRLAVLGVGADDAPAARARAAPGLPQNAARPYGAAPGRGGAAGRCSREGFAGGRGAPSRAQQPAARAEPAHPAGPRGRGCGDCGAARGERRAGANHRRHPRAALPQRCGAGRKGRPLPARLNRQHEPGARLRGGRAHDTPGCRRGDLARAGGDPARLDRNRAGDERAQVRAGRGHGGVPPTARGGAGGADGQRRRAGRAGGLRPRP